MGKVETKVSGHKIQPPSDSGLVASEIAYGAARNPDNDLTINSCYSHHVPDKDTYRGPTVTAMSVFKARELMRARIAERAQRQEQLVVEETQSTKPTNGFHHPEPLVPSEPLGAAATGVIRTRATR